MCNMPFYEDSQISKVTFLPVLQTRVLTTWTPYFQILLFRLCAPGYERPDSDSESNSESDSDVRWKPVHAWEGWWRRESVEKKKRKICRSMDQWNRQIRRGYISHGVGWDFWMAPYWSCCDPGEPQWSAVQGWNPATTSGAIHAEPSRGRDVSAWQHSTTHCQSLHSIPRWCWDCSDGLACSPLTSTQLKTCGHCSVIRSRSETTPQGTWKNWLLLFRRSGKPFQRGHHDSLQFHEEKMFEVCAEQGWTYWVLSLWLWYCFNVPTLVVNCLM